MKIKFTFLFFLMLSQINAQNYSIEEAIALTKTLRTTEILSEKGEDLLVETIQLKQLGETNSPLKPSVFLGFLAEAFNGELIFRTQMPNPEKFQEEIMKLGINELSTDDEIQAAIAKLAPKFTELRGFMIEYAIKGEVNPPPRGSYMPFGFGRLQEQELIHPNRSVIGKHRYQTVEDLKKSGLINEQIYQEVLAEIKNGRLFMENLVLGYAFERSSYYENYDRKKARELTYLDSLEKYEVITPVNKIRLINSYEPFQLKTPFEILPYCNQTSIIQVPNKEVPPAVAYETYFQTIKSLVPNFDYSDFKFNIDTTPSGDNLVKLEATISFKADDQTYQHQFFYDYHKLVLDEWDIIDSFVPISMEFHKPVNKWLADQNSAQRLHFANKSKVGIAYGKDEFGLMILTERQVKGWEHNTTYFLSRENFNNQFNTINTEEHIVFYDSLGLFTHLSPTEIRKGKMKAKTQLINSYSSILYCFPKLIFNFDWETGNLDNPYEQLVNDFASISKGNFQPLDIFDDFEKNWKVATTNLSFVMNGQQYEQTLEMKGDWLDTNFLTLIEKALKDHAIRGAFIYIEEKNGYGGYIFLNPEQHQILKERQPELFSYLKYFDDK